MQKFKTGTVIVIEELSSKKDIFMIVGFDSANSFAYAVLDLVNICFDRYHEVYLNQHAEVLR